MSQRPVWMLKVRQYVLAALAALKPQCILVISSHDADVLALADHQLQFASRESD